MPKANLHLEGWVDIRYFLYIRFYERPWACGAVALLTNRENPYHNLQNLNLDLRH